MLIPAVDQPLVNLYSRFPLSFCEIYFQQLGFSCFVFSQLRFSDASNFGNVVSGSVLPGSLAGDPVVLPGLSLPTGLTAVGPVNSSVPDVPVGGAVPAIGEVSVPCQDDLDIPLSKLIPLSARPHVGEGDPPTEKEKNITGQTPKTVGSEVHKTPSPRFSSFLAECRENPEEQAEGPRGE